MGAPDISASSPPPKWGQSRLSPLLFHFIPAFLQWRRIALAFFQLRKIKRAAT
jgi:hypothetical protein